jgi:hypothetical protein
MKPETPLYQPVSSDSHGRAVTGLLRHPQRIIIDYISRDALLSDLFRRISI